MIAPNAFADHMKVKVGIYQNYPLMFMGDNGEPSGFGADVLKQLAEKEDWDLEFVKGSWAEVYGWYAGER